MRSALSPFIVGVLALTIAAAMVDTAHGQTPAREDPNSGRALYQTFCATCHGDDGTGHGRTAATLTHPVPDLTRLSRAAGGVFPRARVLDSLNGPSPLPAHAREMPQWRDVFTTLEGSPRVVRQRLEALVDYIETLQAKRE